MYDYGYISEVYSDNQSSALKKLLDEKFPDIDCCLVEVIYENGNFKVDSVTVTTEKQDEKLISEIYAYLEELKYINITVYAKSD